MAEALSVWAGRFLDDLAGARRFSPHTLRAYQRDLNRFLSSQNLAVALPGDRVLTPRRFGAFLASLAIEGLSNRSIARAAAVLRSFLTFLYRQGATTSDWAERVPSVKFAAGLPRFLSESQMRQWLDALPTATRWERRDRGLIELMYATGARVAEVVALNWGDIDRQAQMARLYGKRGRERMVPTGTQALRTLEMLAAATPAAATGDGQPVFVNRRGGRLSTRSVERIVQKTFARSVGDGPRRTSCAIPARHIFSIAAPIWRCSSFWGIRTWPRRRSTRTRHHIVWPKSTGSSSRANGSDERGVCDVAIDDDSRSHRTGAVRHGWRWSGNLRRHDHEAHRAEGAAAGRWAGAGRFCGCFGGRLHALRTF